MAGEGFRERFRQLPLASKSLALFGSASAAIIAVALLLPLLRMNGLVAGGQAELARSLLAAWRLAGPAAEPGQAVSFAGSDILVVTPEQAAERGREDRFLRDALRTFASDARAVEETAVERRGWSRLYRFARVERLADDSIARIVVLSRRAEGAGWMVVINLLYLAAAGSVVLAVALVVFAVITSRLILRPVEALKQATEGVRGGNLSTRASVHTGDEFEELSGTFNLMLDELQQRQEQLRSINAALDVKLTELAEANTALFESNRLKGEFLASVSHELRTPLNSIIGFAELLLDIARTEATTVERTGTVPVNTDALRKRDRYLTNIVSSGRNLLEMIESLLEMAKIEAGRVDVRSEPVNLADACQGLVGLIQPLADRKSTKVRLEVGPEVPIVRTDPKKFQQVVFNLLSNAVKFTGNDGRQGEIVVRIERLPPAQRAEDNGAADERIRVSVIDNGPGIAPEDQQRVFQKFQQVEGGHTRQHGGTGLGLAIVAELTRLLQGEVQLVSEVGRGSMFSVILPTVLDAARTEEIRLEARFRGALAGRRSFN
jgi:signal transduction histidine kinase